MEQERRQENLNILLTCNLHTLPLGATFCDFYTERLIPKAHTNTTNHTQPHVVIHLSNSHNQTGPVKIK